MTAVLKSQPELEGFERPTIPELDEKVAAYTAAMYERRRLLEEEARAKEVLLDAIREHELDAYVYQDGDYQYTVRLTTKHKVKCKREAIDQDSGEFEQ